jgi:hypothetical protein
MNVLDSSRIRRALSGGAIAALLPLVACSSEPQSDNQRPPAPEIAGAGEMVRVPVPDPDAPTLESRRQEQLDAISSSPVLFDFSFEDRRPESGIDFRNQVVDDLKRDLKPVHYDHGNGVAIADVDGDGRSDLYFTTQLGSNQLWRNLGDGRFEDFTTPAIAVADRISVAASFADADNDGDPDLYVTTVRMGNLLFENEGGGRFRDVSADSGVDYSGHSSGAVFFDYDLDGRVDLFLVNVGVYTTDARGAGGYYVGLEDAFSGQLYPERSELSRLFRNLGDLRFEDVTEQVGLEDVGWSGDAGFADLSGDS